MFLSKSNHIHLVACYFSEHPTHPIVTGEFTVYSEEQDVSLGEGSLEVTPKSAGLIERECGAFEERVNKPNSAV